MSDEGEAGNTGLDRVLTVNHSDKAGSATLVEATHKARPHGAKLGLPAPGAP